MTIERKPARNIGKVRAYYLLPVAMTPVMLGLCAESAMGQSKGPTVSAFEGTVGDWSIGVWKGIIWTNRSNTPMYTEERILTVQRLKDGKVRCRWAYPPDMPVGWAPQCKIDEKGISLVSTAGSDVELSRNGNVLDGRMRTKSSARWLARLERDQ